MSHKRCYLFALEAAPLTIGQAYDELPLHCTLMHRFWVEMSPEDLMVTVRDVFAVTPTLSDIAYLGGRVRAVQGRPRRDYMAPNGLRSMLEKIAACQTALTEEKLEAMAGTSE